MHVYVLFLVFSVYIVVWLLTYFFVIVSNDKCSLKEYEERAVSLALNRAKLRDLTNRLKAARLTCPLFDTARWVSTVLFSRMK